MKSRKQIKPKLLSTVAIQQAFIVTEEVAGDLSRFILKMGELEYIDRRGPVG